jgi:hypothetical protein
LAVWLLKHFGPETNLEALIGDLQEAFTLGKSNAWYWRQVVAAIYWRKHLRVLLMCVAGSWLLSWSYAGHDPAAISLPLNMAISTAALLIIYYLPGMLRARHRAALVMTSVLLLCWLYSAKDLAAHYSIFPVIFISNLLFYRKKPVPSPRNLTIRELIEGDPEAERQRLIESLHLALLQENDPELRLAYEQAITTLKSSQTRDSMQPI